MKKLLTTLIAFFAMLSIFNTVKADYPEKPITMVIPFGPGGSHDGAGGVAADRGDAGGGEDDAGGRTRSRIAGVGLLRVQRGREEAVLVGEGPDWCPNREGEAAVVHWARRGQRPLHVRDGWLPRGAGGRRRRHGR